MPVFLIKYFNQEVQNKKFSRLRKKTRRGKVKGTEISRSAMSDLAYVPVE